MSDFTQTMKDWRRMCDAHINCSHCPLEHCISPANNRWDEDFDRLERIVDDWAAEHHEPKYPTWGDYISKLVIHDICVGKISGPETVLTYAMNTPIPADIAEKLGIEPK